MKHICSALKRNGEKGFTLVELIVVIAILAILAAVAYPVYTGYIDYTNKGLDRTTVGEINRALELANYDNPTLFTEQGTVVFLTDTGLSSLNPNVTAALKNTFGDDLSTAKLTSNKWNMINGSQIQSVAAMLETNPNSYVQQFWDKNEETSFSGNINELWDKVRKLMDARNSMASTSGERDDFLLHKAVSVSTGENASSIKDIWMSSNRLFETLNTDSTAPGIGKGDGSSAPLAVEVARSSAFVAYAESLDEVKTDATLMEELAEFKTKDALIGESYLTSKALSNSKWGNIRTKYRSEKAEADALAYLGLMQVAKTIEDNIGAENATNDNFYGELSGYVGMTEAMMSSKDNWETAKTCLTGNGVSATVKKSGNGIDITWSDPDIDPRDKENGGDPAYQPVAEDKTKSATINLKTGTLTATSDGGESTGNKVVFTGPGQISIASAAGGITLPDGYHVVSISCNGETQGLNSTPPSPVTAHVGSFTVQMNGTQSACAVTLNVDSSSGAASASTVITFTLTNGTNSYPVDVPVELYNIG